jgi:hypothetical protein
MKYHLTFNGKIVSKKNLLRRSRNGGMFRDANVVKSINALVEQARLQWPNAPLVRPSSRVVFRVIDRRSDIDNKWTNLLDILVKAKVILNDNIKNGPHPQVIDWEYSDTEGADVYLEKD